MESVTDLELAQAWRGGNLAAGRVLRARHERFVRRFFAAKAPSAIERLVAATFAAFVGSQAPRGPQTGVRGALRELARAELARHFRRQRRGTGDPAILRMPLPVRLAFELTYRERLARSEVADALGISPERVDRRLRRAHRTLGRAHAPASASDSGWRSISAH
jgi:DNA-directed RNA polymerase specialized sigma24 family protein